MPAEASPFVLMSTVPQDGVGSLSAESSLFPFLYIKTFVGEFACEEVKLPVLAFWSPRAIFWNSDKYLDLPGL